MAASEVPRSDAEEWRYSRIADLDLGDWKLAVPPTGDRGPLPAPIGPIDGAITITSADGAFDISDVPEALRSAGVVIDLASRLDEAVADLGPVRSDDIFTALSDGFAADAVVVVVPAGVSVDEPIVIHHHLASPGTAVMPRLVVHVGEGADARIIDQVTSVEGPVLSVPLVDLHLAARARLGYLHVQDLGAQAWQIGNLRAEIGQEGDLKAALIGAGGEYARMRTDVRLAGRGANGDLLAAYFGTGEQTLDFRTFQHHDARDTTSDLLFKGAVGDRSRSVYTGLIRVDEAARGTNAYQTNRNIKLSEDAWAESVPNLEINTDDVRCSHASTVGPVDPEQHFYLESRGVPPEVADRLIVAGFFDEVIRSLPVAEAVEDVRALMGAKLDDLGEVVS